MDPDEQRIEETIERVYSEKEFNDSTHDEIPTLGLGGAVAVIVSLLFGILVIWLISKLV